MKALFVYPFCGLGGVETALLNRSEALARRGIHADILFSSVYGDGGAKIAGHPNVLVGWEPEHLRNVVGTYDVISVIDAPEFLDLVDWSATGARLFVETHASQLPSLERFYSGISHHAVSGVLVPAEFNRRLVLTRSRTEKPVTILRNGIDTDRFALQGRSSVERRHASLMNHRIILWIGRLEEEKDPFQAVDIAESLLAEDQGWHFVMVGYTEDGPYRTELVDTALRRPDLAARITFISAVPYEEMPFLYSLAALTGGCLLSTSRHESAPMTFVEAMACDCPVVSSDVGGVREIVWDGVTGRLFPHGDVRAAIRAVREFSADDGRTTRDVVVQAARHHIQSTRSLEQTADTFIDIVKRPSPPADVRSMGPVSGLVSVIIPVFLRPRLLREAVDSLLSQTYRAWELILVDDGSEPETAAMCESLAAEDERIRVVHQPHVGRVGVVRETGRLLARGQYIQYLESDDLLMPRKFEVMVNELRENPDCDVAYCSARRYVTGTDSLPIAIDEIGPARHRMFPSFLQRRSWNRSIPIYTRRITDQAGPWSSVRLWEDVEYDTRIAALNPKLCRCPLFLTDIRDHEEHRLSAQTLWADPLLVRQIPAALRLIYENVRHYGMPHADEHMRAFLGEVGWVAMRCRALGLEEEALGCLNMVREATREQLISTNGGDEMRVQLPPLVSRLDSGTAKDTHA